MEGMVDLWSAVLGSDVAVTVCDGGWCAFYNDKGKFGFNGAIIIENRVMSYGVVELGLVM
jgi:hypothetical protein